MVLGTGGVAGAVTGVAAVLVAFPVEVGARPVVEAHQEVGRKERATANCIKGERWFENEFWI